MMPEKGGIRVEKEKEISNARYRVEESERRWELKRKRERGSEATPIKQ